MSDAYDATKAIEQTCNDLVDSYEDLAEMGAGLLATIKSTIGQLRQYKYTVHWSGSYSNPSVEYRDDPYSWWEKALIWTGGGAITEEIVDHPRQQEALDALADTQGIVDGADEKFEFDAGHMRDSVASIASHMSGWVGVSSLVSRLIFPSRASQVPTSGDIDGWRSPSAFSTYEDNLAIQHDAHETTATSIETMLTRDGNFVETLGDHLIVFAELQGDQNEYYAGLVAQDWAPDKWSITSVIQIVGEIGTKVTQFQQLQVDEIKAVVSTLNSAVSDILQTEEQKNTINRLSEPSGQGEVGWPEPAPLSSKKGAGETSYYDLTFQTQYFKDHITHWSDLSGDFTAPVDQAEAAPAIETMFHQFPGFMATTASGLNSLADHIKDKALVRGKAATKEISEILDDTIRTYVAGEDLNAQQANELQKLLDE
ncbi:hypothetical protein GCM10009785_14830 [Brooklawnia cerclae]|uniref:Uncharacterized protein n=1 Tax=Brooklawnia cerclae TaxID=349934 RepID=A0ABX0SIZ6_9ACTN|nr:hypothetical protein [Brooklawnia cerclae]NIH57946.1 hypothetical protein [Brooklawnia cerclae]